MAPGTATEPTPVCLNEPVTAPELQELLAQAVDVLESCGHAPEDYAVELQLDDPFARVGTRRRAEVTVVFEPLDDRRHYALGVNASDPCVVTWVWRPQRFTDWQKSVLKRAREAAAGWAGHTEKLELQVAESHRHVGVRLWSGETTGGPELRIVLDKQTLTVVESGSIGD